MAKIDLSKCLICQSAARPDGKDLCDACQSRQDGAGADEPKRLKPESYRSIHKALTEFGYPLTLEWVEAKTNELLDGGECVGGPDMFIHGFLEKAGLVEPLKRKSATTVHASDLNTNNCGRV